MIVSNDPSPLTFISDYNVRLPEIYGKKNRDEEDIINAYKHRKTQKNTDRRRVNSHCLTFHEGTVHAVWSVLDRFFNYLMCLPKNPPHMVST